MRWHLLAGGAWVGLGLVTATSAQPSALVVPKILYTPASAVELAYQDMQRLPAEQRPTTRYLSAYLATSQEDIDNLYRLSSFVANSLNTKKRQLVLPVKVDGVGRLLRIDLAALGIDPEAWDQLGRKGSGSSPLPDPYFHQELEQAARTVTVTEKRWWPGGYHGGRYWAPGYYQETFTKQVNEKQTILAQASWLPRAKTIELVQQLQSEMPVYRADWFIVYGLQPPAYQRFLGKPKDFDDYLQLGGIRRAVFQEVATALRAGVLRSEVANHNRGVQRLPTGRNYGRGYWYESFDYRTSIRADDVTQNLLNRRRDAGELIWSLPNGLQGYGIVAAQGKNEIVAEFVDSRIAADNRSRLADRTIYTGWRCVFCHSQGSILVDDAIRSSARGPQALLVTDPKQAERIADIYFGEDLNRLLLADQQHYNTAVLASTGKAAAAISLDFQELCRRYLDEPLGIEDIAIETGYPVPVVRSIVEEVGRVGLDPTYVRLLGNRKARRDQHEAAFANLMRVLALVKEKP